MHKFDTSWKKAVLFEGATIEDAILNLNMSSLRIILVSNDEGELKGTISDGDIRRGLLRGLDLKSSIESIIHRNTIAVPPTISRDLVLELMILNKIQQIPVIDGDQKIQGLFVWDEITSPSLQENIMVIMAGGKGTRLHPFTESCPKPLIEVAGKPMLLHIIERAKHEGFRNFYIAIHHLGKMIEDYFGDGSEFGVNIQYLREETPLGTAGALSLLKPCPTEAFVVTNGDVMTDIKYADILDFHNRHNAFATMAVRTHEWQHPFGVVQTKGIDIVGFQEKPIAKTHINAGVYVLSPEALRELDENIRCDMPDLFEKLWDKSGRTVAYPMHEPWLDVGKPDDLKKANHTAAQKMIDGAVK